MSRDLAEFKESWKSTVAFKIKYGHSDESFARIATKMAQGCFWDNLRHVSG